MKNRKHHRETAIILLFRRRRSIFHLVPFFLSLSGVVLVLFLLISYLSPPINSHHDHFISRISSTGGGSLSRDLWNSKKSNFYHGCSISTEEFPTAEVNTLANRYLLIATSGGLNQQRTGIIDAVVAAHILNAILVIPKLDQQSYWKDSSNFSEIFDVNWFISYLSKDVKIIKDLPRMGDKLITPHTTRVPRKCNAECYQTRIQPILNKKHAVQLTKFDYRLSNHLDMELQKLRCRVNYHALKFTDPIIEMGRKLVERIRKKSKHFLALHLRFESDMLAFSGCYYGGGEKERRELGKIRKRWKTLHARSPDKERKNGKCLLTPEEVGLMLRALGFGNDVHIYIASGEIYGGEETLAPLKDFFPNFYTKETLASKEELAPFSSFSSRMAALDFIVCDESDVFVSNNNGNMARMLAGRRRYFGHKPTIRPNAKKLYKLFMDRNNMTWGEFASHVQKHQIGFMGDPMEVNPGRGEFHENPSACICEDTNVKAREDVTIPHSPAMHFEEGIDSAADGTRRSFGKVIDGRIIEDEQDWFDTDYMENEVGGIQSSGGARIFIKGVQHMKK
ncbi:O-fucosyltransferase 6-like isoform X1 [Solanum dulcamara]|uniref:O-fucosyltransferase 6-like isoform X1 n=1 Tax=Solanum dulcamara TaxID=45834 RepID=UPI0024866D6B|nr:O-fucosyltransferase 6-like isoform X1 [Solanum dulcamara]